MSFTFLPQVKLWFQYKNLVMDLLSLYKTEKKETEHLHTKREKYL